MCLPSVGPAESSRVEEEFRLGGVDLTAEHVTVLRRVRIEQTPPTSVGVHKEEEGGG